MKHLTKTMPIIATLILFALAGCAAPGPAATTVSPTGAVLSATQAPTENVPSVVETPTMTAPVVTELTTVAPANPPTSEPSSSAESGNLKFTIVAEKSQANYRVREQLASLNLPNDAVGVTKTVSGTITIQPDGTLVASESQIVVDVTNLTSDNSRRDNYVRRNTLQTDQYPQVTFVPTEVTGLPTPLPESGEIAFQLSGDLTIRDVTRPVTWEVTGQIQDGQIIAKATTTFTFADFNITQPRVPVVLSVEDNITLEADLVLQK